MVEHTVPQPKIAETYYNSTCTAEDKHNLTGSRATSANATNMMTTTTGASHFYKQMEEVTNDDCNSCDSGKLTVKVSHVNKNKVSQVKTSPTASDQSPAATRPRVC